MTALTPNSAKQFMLDNTALMAPPHVPELLLHLADEAHDLWQRTEDELVEIGLPPPFWAFAWAGGQGLARYVIDNPDTVRGKRVLDFASGSGLVAIAAARAGATSVMAAEIDANARTALRLNAGLNGVAVEVVDHDLTGEQPPDVDVLLVGDLFYAPRLASRVTRFVDRCLDAGIGVLVGAVGRSHLPTRRLRPLAGYYVSDFGETRTGTVFSF